MKPTTRPRVKICCMASVKEARMAIEAGASAVGLVSAMPSGPGPIPDELIAEIAATIPPGVSSFLLTCLQDAASIIEQQRRLRVNTIQICDRLTQGSYQDLREALPGISLVQVVHVTGPEAIDEAIAVAPQVDAILLDSGNQSLAIKELGGTGRTHDWTLSRKIREAIEVPLFLAG
ncbi:MAG TPA: phosphoribosylanthranilate isomerase, partial [Pyrinomonadaceae bacterium]|nr:phosphoribosylanthranilate isomerase [Pyrinomonadaceae bacterium]